MGVLERVLNQYGFGVAMAAFMGFLLWNILKWTKSQIENLIAAADRREEMSRKMWESHRLALESHTEQAKTFHQEVSSAHQFQRVEHDRQITALDKIIDKLTSIRPPA